MAVENQGGQATIEYILLIAVVVSFFFIVVRWISGTDIAFKATQSITSTFAAAYRYGHTQAKGPEDLGGPMNHPRAEGGQNNFRIFLNPYLR